MATPTVESFAARLTINDEGLNFGDLIPEEAKVTSVKRQRAIIQSKSLDEQMELYSKFSAKYLPRLLNAWKLNEGSLNSHACMLNLIGSNGVLYFARFVKLPEARGMAGLQIKRMASDDFPGTYDADDLGEIGQFLSTLLMFQGDADVEPQHRAAVLPKLKYLKRRYMGEFPGDTAERCYEYLSGDMVSVMMHTQIKNTVEGEMLKCGAMGCLVALRGAGTELMQCARCKIARYCSVEHQKQAWLSHKTICFPTTF